MLFSVSKQICKKCKKIKRYYRHLTCVNDWGKMCVCVFFLSTNKLKETLFTSWNEHWTCFQCISHEWNHKAFRSYFINDTRWKRKKIGHSFSCARFANESIDKNLWIIYHAIFSTSSSNFVPTCYRMNYMPWSNVWGHYFDIILHNNPVFVRKTHQNVLSKEISFTFPWHTHSTPTQPKSLMEMNWNTNIC